MSKRTFNGQNDAPAPPQGFNQSVHDNPTHGKSATPVPKKTASLSGSGPTGDPRDMHAKAPSTIQAGGDSQRKNYLGELDHSLGEDHGGLSGIRAAEKPAKKK